MRMWGNQDTLLGEAFEHDKFICISKACGVALSCIALTKESGTTCDLTIASDFELLQSFVFPCLTLAELSSLLGLPSQELSSRLGVPLHELLPADLQITDLPSQYLLNLDLLALGFLALDHLFIDLDHVLEAFECGGTCRSDILRCAGSLVSLLRRCKVASMSSRVPVSISDGLLSVSDQLCQSLNAVDDTLYPVIRPMLALAMLVIFGHCCSLNIFNESLHACQLFCRACLVFFEKTDLLSDFKELKLLIHVQCLSAWKDFDDNYTKDEIDFVQNFVKMTEKCIEQCPQSYIKEDALSAVIDAKVRLFPDDADIKRKCVLDIASIIDKEPEPSIVDVVKDTIRALKDGQQLRKTVELADTLVEHIGGLLKLKEERLATKAFRTVDATYWMCLQMRTLQSQVSQISNNCFFQQLQKSVFLNVARFRERHGALVADMLVKWKCVYSEFCAILVSLGVGRECLKTSQAIITQVDLADQIDVHQTQQLAADHVARTEEIVKHLGGKVLSCLKKQSYKDVQRLLEPDQAVIEYSIDALEAPRAQNVPKSKGLVMCLVSEGEPLILELEHVTAMLVDWVNMLNESERTDEVERKTCEAAITLCKVLLPASIEDIIVTKGIKRLYLCTDAWLGMLPLELVPIGGQTLHEVCSLSYLSSCRELLRQDVIAEMVPQAGSANPASMECVIFADPDFNLSSTHPHQPAPRDSVRGALLSKGTQFLLPSQLLSGTCKPLNLLPNTAKEAECVQTAVATYRPNISTDVICEKQATLSSALNIKSPFILHFATHGFSDHETRFGRGSFWDDTKSGLYLAGANVFLEEEFEKIHPDASTGVLTSLAVSGIDLRGTALVFISACVSAVGTADIGDAVNSLAKAFRAAGAQTVVATIWPLHDAMAPNLVKHFYEEVLKDGVAPSQALSAAKNKVYENFAEHAHWYYWGSLICIGEDKPLFVSS